MRRFSVFSTATHDKHPNSVSPLTAAWNAVKAAEVRLQAQQKQALEKAKSEREAAIEQANTLLRDRAAVEARKAALVQSFKARTSISRKDRSKFWKNIAAYDKDIIKLTAAAESKKREAYLPSRSGYLYKTGSDGVYVGIKSFWLEHVQCGVGIHGSAVSADATSTTKPDDVNRAPVAALTISLENVRAAVGVRGFALRTEKGKGIPDLSIDYLKVEVGFNVVVPLLCTYLGEDEVPHLSSTSHKHSSDSPAEHTGSAPTGAHHSGSRRDSKSVASSAEGAKQAEPHSPYKWQIDESRMKFELFHFDREQSGTIKAPRKIIRWAIEYIVPSLIKSTVVPLIPPEFGALFASKFLSLALKCTFEMKSLPSAILEMPLNARRPVPMAQLGVAPPNTHTLQASFADSKQRELPGAYLPAEFFAASPDAFEGLIYAHAHDSRPLEVRRLTTVRDMIDLADDFEPSNVLWNELLDSWEMLASVAQQQMMEHTSTAVRSVIPLQLHRLMEEAAALARQPCSVNFTVQRIDVSADLLHVIHAILTLQISSLRNQQLKLLGQETDAAIASPALAKQLALTPDTVLTPGTPHVLEQPRNGSVAASSVSCAVDDEMSLEVQLKKVVESKQQLTSLIVDAGARIRSASVCTSAQLTGGYSGTITASLTDMHIVSCSGVHIPLWTVEDVRWPAPMYAMAITNNDDGSFDTTIEYPRHMLYPQSYLTEDNREDMCVALCVNAEQFQQRICIDTAQLQKILTAHAPPEMNVCAATLSPEADGRSTLSLFMSPWTNSQLNCSGISIQAGCVPLVSLLSTPEAFIVSEPPIEAKLLRNQHLQCRICLKAHLEQTLGPDPERLKPDLQTSLVLRLQQADTAAATAVATTDPSTSNGSTTTSAPDYPIHVSAQLILGDIMDEIAKLSAIAETA